MKKLKKISKPFEKEKILNNLTIDGEGIGVLSAIEIDLPLPRTFLLNLLSDFAKGKKDIWQLKDSVDVFCTLQERALMDDLKNWGIETTGISLTIFITEAHIKAGYHPFIIEWAVLFLFKNPAVYKISSADIFTIRKFLMTPLYQLEEIFRQWDHYWNARCFDHDKASHSL